MVEKCIFMKYNKKIILVVSIIAVLVSVGTVYAGGDGTNIIFRTSPDGISSNEVMRITSDQRVGIGTNTPQSTLDVNGIITSPTITEMNRKTDCNIIKKNSGLQPQFNMNNGCNLYLANLSYADLSYANLSNAYLSGVTLTNANLSGTNLTNAYLANANLSNAYLGGANLFNANLRGANLSSANLFDANLSGANLTNANLSNANLFNANLSGVTLSGTYANPPCTGHAICATLPLS